MQWRIWPNAGGIGITVAAMGGGTQQFQNGDITGKISNSPISICQKLAFPSNFPVQDHLLKSAISPGNFGENVSSLTPLGR